MVRVTTIMKSANDIIKADATMGQVVSMNTNVPTVIVLDTVC